MTEFEIYLDHNSTSPPLSEVVLAMTRAAGSLWGNPSSVHATGRRARAALEAAREALGRALDFDARDVLFTASATEANNLALAGATQIVTTRLEHPSITRAAEHRAAEGSNVVWLAADDGLFHPEALERCLAALERPERTLVAIAAANHETGTLQPIDALARVTRRFGARLHVDGVQWLGKGDAALLGMGDSVSVSAHKLGGPKGIGALAMRGSLPTPILFGGAQERGLRPGTQDAVLATGFAVALEHALAAPARRAGLAALRDRLERGLAGRCQVNGGSAPRLPHVSNLSFMGLPGPELAAALDLAGVRVSSGSACSAGTPEPSPVIAALHGPARAASALRFSLGEGTTQEQIDSVIQTLLRILDGGSFAPQPGSSKDRGELQKPH